MEATGWPKCLRFHFALSHYCKIHYNVSYKTGMISL